MRDTIHCNPEESVVSIHTALKLNSMRYLGGEGVPKMGWFKIGRRWELLRMGEVNILRARKFILAPPHKEVIRWLRENLGIWPMVKDNLNIGKEPFELNLCWLEWKKGKKEIIREQVIRDHMRYEKAIEEGIKLSIREYYFRKKLKPRN